MAYISFKPTDNVKVVGYSGNAGTKAVTGTGFEPALVWLKGRNFTDDNVVYDAVRGTNKWLATNRNYVNGTNAAPNLGITSFDANGFTVGPWSAINPSGTNNMISYSWKGGTTSVPSGGSITPSAVNMNATAGFYSATYTGSGAVNATLAHGLGKVPKFIAIKKLNTTYNWANTSTVWDDNTKILSWTIVNSLMTDDVFTTAPNSTYIYLGSNTYGNAANGSGTYLVYAWSEIPGYSKMTSYTGTGNADGPFVYCGFEPQWLMIKETDSTSGWCMYDNVRPTTNPGYYNPNTNFLQAQETGVESPNANLAIDFLSNGFKVRNGAGDTNGNGNSYMVLAFANNPIVGTNDTPGVAR